MAPRSKNRNTKEVSVHKTLKDRLVLASNAMRHTEQNAIYTEQNIVYIEFSTSCHLRYLLGLFEYIFVHNTRHISQCSLEKKEILMCLPAPSFFYSNSGRFSLISLLLELSTEERQMLFGNLSVLFFHFIMLMNSTTYSNDYLPVPMN